MSEAAAIQLEPRTCASCRKAFNVPASSTATTCADCALGAAMMDSPPANYTNQADVEKRKGAKGQLIGGLVLLALGIGITAATYNSASKEGGTYYIAYGPAIAGLLMTIRGLINLA